MSKDQVECLESHSSSQFSYSKRFSALTQSRKQIYFLLQLDSNNFAGDRCGVMKNNSGRLQTLMLCQRQHRRAYFKSATFQKAISRSLIIFIKDFTIFPLKYQWHTLHAFWREITLIECSSCNKFSSDRLCNPRNSLSWYI